MGTVTVSLPADGSVGTVSQYNTPLTTVVNEFNGNIDNNNIKSSAAIDGSKIAAGTVTNDRLSTTAGEVGGAWLAWTPTITSGTGTITTSSGAGRYTKIGKTIIFKASLTITTNGTGASWVNFTLPANALFTGAYIGSGRANLLTGKMLQIRNVSATVTSVYNYDNSYPAASGEVLEVSGCYEAA